MSDSAEAYTGVAENPEFPSGRVTFRDMIEELRVAANEEMGNFRSFGHPSRKRRAEIWDAIANLILALIMCGDQVMPILRRQKGRGGVR